MMEEKSFKLEEIKEIILNWDWYTIHLPKNVLRNFSCVYNKEKDEYLHEIGNLQEAYLEIDLDFVLNDDRKNDEIDILTFNSFWNIVITTIDDKMYGLVLPFYNKKLYIEQKSYVLGVPNTFEEHKRTKESYIIHWKEDKEKVRLTMDEMIELFKNKTKRGAIKLQYNIQIDILDIILEKAKKDRDDFFSIFCFLGYDNSIHHIKSEYEIRTEYQEEKGFSNIVLHLDNGENNGLIQFTFVKDVTNYRDILELLNFNLANKTFGKTILILDNNQKIAKKELTELEDVIVMNLDELNQIWFQYLHERDSL